MDASSIAMSPNLPLQQQQAALEGADLHCDQHHHPSASASVNVGGGSTSTSSMMNDARLDRAAAQQLDRPHALDSSPPDRSAPPVPSAQADPNLSRPRRSRASSLPSVARSASVSRAPESIEPPSWLQQQDRPEPPSAAIDRTKRSPAAVMRRQPRRSRPPQQQQKRDARRVDPDEHWLSEDEGSTHVESYVDRQARLVESGHVGGSSSNHPRDPPAPPSSGFAQQQQQQHSTTQEKRQHAETQAQSADEKKKQAQSATLKPTLDILVPSFLDDMSTLAEHLPMADRLWPILSRALTCHHCHSRMVKPISLPCGHSICARCAASSASASSPSDQVQKSLRSSLGSLKNILRPSTDGQHQQHLSHRRSSFASAQPAAPTAADMTEKLVTPELEPPIVSSVVSPICPMPDCFANSSRAKHGSSTMMSSSGDPLEGYRVTPDVTLMKLLDVAAHAVVDTDSIVGLQDGASLDESFDEKGAETEKDLMASADLSAAAKQGKDPHHLARVVLNELECQVCFNLLVEPTTTRCSHTFCRRCLARSLDHSEYCPLCRSHLPAFHHFAQQKPNKALSHLLTNGFPHAIQARALQQKEEESSPLPIFVCTLAFPSVPTFLHIFEPRYRLMVRRAWEGDKRFGMCMPGEHGGVHPYGTVLQIRKLELLPDGRSLIETVGTDRFRLGTTDVLDGYTVAQVEVIEDLDDEQQQQAEQQSVTTPEDRIEQIRQSLLNAGQPLPERIAPELTTAQLVQRCHESLNVMRSGAAPWLRQKLNDTLGPVPENPANLSFYMAALLPVYEYEKARLLPMTNVRERLLLLVSWMDQLQESWWYNSGCALS